MHSFFPCLRRYFPQTDGNCGTGHCGLTTNLIHNKYFLMNSRYERAGTVGFRCAADVKGSATSDLDCKGKAICGGLRSPTAVTMLGAAEEWVLLDGADTVRSTKKGRISDPISGEAGQALLACAGTQNTFTWQSGSKQSTLGRCLRNGTHGIVFNVNAVQGKRSVLSVYAGSTAASAMITATLQDGGKTTVFTEDVAAVSVDIEKNITYNLRWVLNFTATSPAAVLTVNVSAASLSLPAPPPPPPTPPPAQCRRALCGAFAKHAGDASLTSTGTSDWTHYGLAGSTSAVNRKCGKGVSLIRPLGWTGGVKAFNNCPQTFSWTDGGCINCPSANQVGAVDQTASAVFVGNTPGKGGGSFTVAVGIPQVNVATSVYLYVGACGSTGVLTTTLIGTAGAVEGTYNHSMSAHEGSQCQYTAIATLTIPPVKPQGTNAGGTTRTLMSTWAQDVGESKTKPTNLQFHAVAVDAGGPVGSGPLVPCGHDERHVEGTVILQAAVLA